MTVTIWVEQVCTIIVSHHLQWIKNEHGEGICFAFLQVITRALSKYFQVRNYLASKAFIYSIIVVNDQHQQRASLGNEILILEVFLAAPVKKSSSEKKDAYLPSYSGCCSQGVLNSVVMFCFVFLLQKFLTSIVSHSCFIKLLHGPSSNNKKLILSSDRLNSK